MKLYIYLSLILGLLISCSKEKDGSKPDTPSTQMKIETLRPTLKYGKGVMFSGRVLHLSKEHILEHGFFVRYQVNFGRFDSVFYKIDQAVQSGDNSLLLNNIPESFLGNLCEVRYVVTTKEGNYSGQYIEFRNVDVSVAADYEFVKSIGDEIVVSGDFSKANSSYRLIYESTNGSGVVQNFNINQPNQNTLSFKIPSFPHGTVAVFKLSNGLSSDIYLARVNVVGKLLPFDQYEYYLDDRLPIKTLGIGYQQRSPFFLIVGNKYFSYPVDKYVSELIEGQKGSSFRIGYFNGVDTVIFPTKLSVRKMPADAFQFSQSFVHPFGDVRVSSLSLSRHIPIGDHSVFLGGKEARLYRRWNSDDVLTIEDVADGKYPLFVKNDVADFTSTQQVTVRKLSIDKISPNSFYHGQQLTLEGNFVDDNVYFVESVDGDVVSAMAKNGRLVILPRESNYHSYDIRRVGYFRREENIHWENFDFKVKINPATYTGFSPSSGNYDTLIKFYGKGLQGARLVVNAFFLSFDDYGDDWASLRLQRYILPGKYKFSIYYKGGWLMVDQDYTLRAN